ncbi:MAG: NAD(+)/NADH kinase [Chloroflexi bacterium]|nr:NAD(+)/NADH kinase [Chloroflexota bacterium]
MKNEGCSRKKVGILFQPKISAAMKLAQKLEKVVADTGAAVWLCSAWDEEKACQQLNETRLIVCLGGDGTIIRAARIACTESVPILGVNLGRVGFMTELSPDEALTRVPAFIDGEGWVEERAMLQAEVVSGDGKQYHALNDVVVARGGRCRLIRIKATINGELLTTYKCDGLIAATATGSTGYALAAGGPILNPQSGDIILKPVAAHLSLSAALVLPSEATVELAVSTTHQATMSIDGQIEVPLNDGDVVRVKSSPYVTRMLRAQWPSSFYSTLMKRLDKQE